jgi:lysozyme
MIDSVEQLITKHEGCEFNVYLDSKGIQTIGIGHNLQASPMPYGWTTPLTQDQVNELFQSDLNNVLNQLSDNLPWVSKLDMVRQAVVVDMCFNMGIETLLTFKRTLACIESGAWQDAADDMLQSLWALQVPTRAQEDSQMMVSGNWPEN